MKTPVIVIGFNRPKVLELSLTNLAQCQDVTGRDIYVYVDGARSTEEQVSVDAVIEVVCQIQRKALPNLRLKMRNENYGCQKNICSAIDEILALHGKMCLIEDDVLVSRTFLSYMDEALDFYSEDSRIFNINGYKPRYLRIPKSYQYDVYLDMRNHTPGWGIWKDRWDKIEFGLSDWDDFKQDKGNLSRLCMAGYDLYAMLEHQVHKPGLEAWDAQCTYHMVKYGLFAIAPRFSLSKNIGFGMKSLHCGAYNPIMPTQKYYNFHPVLTKDIVTDKVIVDQLKYVSQSPRLFDRILRKLYRGLLHFSPKYLEPCLPPFE